MVAKDEGPRAGVTAEGLSKLKPAFKADGTVTETGLPKSNVIYFDLEDNAWCCARPSGTEPKIKFYMGVKGTSFEDADNKVENLKNDMMAIVE